MRKLTELLNLFFDSIADGIINFFGLKSEEKNKSLNCNDSYPDQSLNNCNINFYAKIAEIKYLNYPNKKNDLEAYESIIKILLWCNKRNLKIIFSGSEKTRYSIGNRTIYINTTKNIFRQVCGILHECGHSIIIDENLNVPDINPRKYSRLLENVINKNKKFLNFKEEVYAWERGFDLSKKLNITLDLDDYISYRDACLQTYSKNI